MKNSVENLVGTVANLSEKSASAGTFGVGGILVDKSSNILVKMLNRVIQNDSMNDPTAHVERQIVDWYYEQIAQQKNLPPPSELTIISSLDPCMMCAGSILAAGFNVVSMSFDDFAGINYEKSETFRTLPGSF